MQVGVMKWRLEQKHPIAAKLRNRYLPLTLLPFWKQTKFEVGLCMNMVLFLVVMNYMKTTLQIIEPFYILLCPNLTEDYVSSITMNSQGASSFAASPYLPIVYMFLFSNSFHFGLSLNYSTSLGEFYVISCEINNYIYICMAVLE